MPIQQYDVNNYQIEAVLSWIQEGRIAIPEISKTFCLEGSQSA